MRVKIGNTWYDSKDTAICVEYDDREHELLAGAKVPDGQTNRYASVPEHTSLSDRNVRDWMHDAQELPPELDASVPVRFELRTESARKWAQGLILQLPSEHDGRNSWLLNYGTGREANELRSNWLSMNAARRYRGMVADRPFAEQTSATLQADSGPAPESKFLERAVGEFADAMRTKMDACRAGGKYGWDNPAECSDARLSQLMAAELYKANGSSFVDIANFAMILHRRKADPEELRKAIGAPHQAPLNGLTAAQHEQAEAEAMATEYVKRIADMTSEQALRAEHAADAREKRHTRAMMSATVLQGMIVRYNAEDPEFLCNKAVEVTDVLIERLDK